MWLIYYINCRFVYQTCECLGKDGAESRWLLTQGFHCILVLKKYPVLGKKRNDQLTSNDIEGLANLLNF